MKKLIIGLSVIIFLASCQNSGISKEVERTKMQPVALVNDSIETMFPAGIYLTDNYILWTNPFHSEKFVHILDRESGKELGKMVNIGEGPDEFVSPSIIPMSYDRLFIYNSYTGKVGIQSIPAAVQGENPIIMVQNRNLGDGSSILLTEEDEMILFNPSQSQPFALDKGGKITGFGHLPVKGEIKNGVNHFQGKIAYNPYNQRLVYTSLMFPYYAVYKRLGDTFILQNEILNTNDYVLKDNEFSYQGSMRGPQDITLTADYIVTIERDPTTDQLDGMKIGRDFSKLPRSIFLYDYDFRLQKIIDLDRPLAWITGDPRNNTIYIISLDEDFVILKYEL